MIWKKLDLKDVFIFSGLILIAIGLYKWEPWVSYCVTGSFVFALGILGTLKR